jgi:DNA processing protein
MSIDRRTSLMILAALPGLGPVNLRKLDPLIAGGVERLLEMDAVEAGQWCPAKVVRQLSQWQTYFDPKKVFPCLEKMGADFVTSEEADYPSRLNPFSDRPVGLYRCRSGLQVPERSIAIVGTRKPSAYGRKVAREFSGELCRQGYCIVSGLAEGIDTEAHRTALECGGQTLAVLGGGLNCCYPPSNRGLMEAIKDSAGVWTEFPLWRRADRRSFPQRNRIVAGLSEGTVVVESGDAGGSLITARMASEQGKPVYVVPGRIDAHESRGCHDLIRDGAQLVTCVDDILRDLDHLPGILRSAHEPCSRRQHRPNPRLQGLQALIWEHLLEQSHAHLDGIAKGTGRRVAEVSGTLLEMEMSGLVCRRLDGRYEPV